MWHKAVRSSAYPNINPSVVLQGTTLAIGLAALMVCPKCGSKDRVQLNAELSLTHGKLERVGKPPIYLVQKTVVCTNCGLLELKVPKPKLRLLKQSKVA